MALNPALRHSEFRIADEYPYDRRTAVRWIFSHLWRHRLFFVFGLLSSAGTMFLHSLVPRLTGQAFDTLLLGAEARAALLRIVLTVLAVAAARCAMDLASYFVKQTLASRFQRDAREELEISLLGKSQTFHNQQRIGDIMARATNDVNQLGEMIMPGATLILDSVMAVIFPLGLMAAIHPQLLIVPLVYVAVLIAALKRYNRRLNPVSGALQMQYGHMNAGLTEAITGIELVKSTAREALELDKFLRNAGRHRDYFMQQGRIQALYWPMLYLGIGLTVMFAHSLWLVSQNQITLGELVAFMGLAYLLRFPTFISIFTFTLVQMGRAGAERILALINQDTELDRNAQGHAAAIRGRVEFDRVHFAYAGNAALQDVTFTVEPGESIAIVGQTGSGKSTLTKLVNRIFDCRQGAVRVDGVDVKDWNLAALRRQISTIEQDVFLYSRSLAENIGFGQGPDAPPARIEQAARAAQAHDFIVGFQDGYATEIGERGVTLSGGQRQRIAIARALLTDPRILIIDDSTSAVDSATEDEIQRAINAVMAGRTTFLITHRIAQIRKAHKILVLAQGRVVDIGAHRELMERCELYRRIFLRDETSLANGRLH